MTRRPDFVIVGAQKAGSSLLHHALREHPEIWLRAAEDPYFRDPVFDESAIGEFERAYAGRGERRIGMKCPDYLARPEVPARLRTHLHDPDLIVTLRDPVSRLLSAYFWFMRWGIVPVRPAEEGLREALRHTREGSAGTDTQLLDWGLYGRHLAHYLRYFPRERMHVVLDHDLRREPAASVRDVYTFLGVRPDIAPPTSSTENNPGIYSLRRLEFLQRRTKYVLHWDSSGTFPSIPKARRLGPRLYCDAVTAVDRFVLSRVHADVRPQLSAELTAELHEYYRDDIALLEDLLGIDLQRWRDGAATGRGVPPAS